VDTEDLTDPWKMKKKGHYFGTEINGKWWKRYRKDKMCARGSGEYWYDGRSFHFRRYLPKAPLVFDFGNLEGIKRGNWHAGQWSGGGTIVKLLWEKDGLRLSSGFLLSRNRLDTENIITEMEGLIQEASDRDS
jgi:hypothetical protein